VVIVSELLIWTSQVRCPSQTTSHVALSLDKSLYFDCLGLWMRYKIPWHEAYGLSYCIKSKPVKQLNRFMRHRIVDAFTRLPSLGNSQHHTWPSFLEAHRGQWLTLYLMSKLTKGDMFGYVVVVVVTFCFLFQFFRRGLGDFFIGAFFMFEFTIPFIALRHILSRVSC
jgi:hypothetical protein